MKEILLTQNKVALVDDEDFEVVNKHKWCAMWDGYNWYAVRGIDLDKKHKTIYMHREILNIPNGIKGDHRNGNGLDNRKGNLRLATHSQNMQNLHKAHKNNSLGIKGVRWCKKFNKFDARITVEKKNIHLGYFNVMGDADSAYRIAEEKYFGEFARKE